MMITDRHKILKRTTILLITAAIALYAFGAYAENIDPDSTGCKYAWAENVGWINFNPSLGPGVTVTDTAVTGMAWGENIGWINLSPTNYGGVVNKDGTGNLEGYAWGENVGWINFKPSGSGVSIGSDGKFSGYAWGENIGWINFSSLNSCVKTSWVSPDVIPNPFTFIAQTGVALNTLITSNNITVSGINAPSAISISGGQYSINNGVYISTTGTVNSGDSVRVQLTSSPAYATMTNATLTIGGVSATFVVTTQSAPPIASAGPNQSVHVGQLVTLDGSGSSDPWGFVPLTYAWSFFYKPAGSAAILSDPAALDPAFTADLPGDYVVLLSVVNSVGVASMPSYVTISSNTTPVASAGPDQTVHVGHLVTLDGSGSSDPGGNYPLTYQWTTTKAPAGSSCLLFSPGTVNPSFLPDLPGDYIITLVVTNCLGASSQPSSVTISTINTPPVASAGPDQAVTLIGAKIQLDGSQSYDPDGDPITYLWSFVSIPAGSAAKLSNPTIVNPTFIADVHGTYLAQLVVRDPWSQSASARVTISFENVKPVANAGKSQSAVVGDTVTLNGSGSFDANGDPLTYQWSFASLPAGSASSIVSPTSAATSFVPDLPGMYVVKLIVNDGFVNSDPSTVQVQVITVQTEAVQQTQNIQNTVASLNPSVLQNANMQNALINKLNAVLANIAAANYASALDQLQNDILRKTDGCATTGAPDKNDWINNCAAQGQVYPMIMDLISYLKKLL